MKKREVWVKPEVRQAFETKLMECLAVCQTHCKETLPTPQLIFKNIGGSGGRCIWSYLTNNSVIIINPAYFQKPGGYERQLTVTLGHEIAHHVCDYIHRNDVRRIMPHGHEWARVMHWIGLSPDRCHQMDSEGIVRRHERPYSYKCPCGTPHLLTATLHLRIQRDGRTRICKRCHNRIVYEGIRTKGGLLPAAKPAPQPRPEPFFRVVSQQPFRFEVKPEPPKPAPLPQPTHRVVTRLINGVLTNVRIPLDNP